jgi:hypothetical protein
MKTALFLGCTVALTTFVVACGGGSNAGSTATAGSGTPASSRSVTGSTAAVSNTPIAAGPTLTADKATALLETSLLKPADLPAVDGWKVGTDTTVDNAAAAKADPTSDAGNARCGRLLGRTMTLTPADVVGSYIAGKTVSFFSTMNVYASAAGAADCAAEAAVRFQQPGELARAFGSVFTDPASVVLTPVTFPSIGDGSFAGTLAGKTNANGLVVDLTILIVAFRQGAATAVVGSAANTAPSIDELAPFVGLVNRRLAAAQK